MKATLLESRPGDTSTVAKLNRQILGSERVFTVSVLGGPGCGKTTLIDATIRRLMADMPVGVIACDVSSRLDADRMSRDSDQVVQVAVGPSCGSANATHIRDALDWIDLQSIDLLLIENVGTLTGPADVDLGQNARVAVFCVAAGHDQPGKHPEQVRAADLVVLTKTDLLPSVPFDQAEFRASIRRLNPTVRLIELSALVGTGMDQWLAWLKGHVTPSTMRASHWFG